MNYANPSGAETGIFLDNLVSTMATDALGPESI